LAPLIVPFGELLGPYPPGLGGAWAGITMLKLPDSGRCAMWNTLRTLDSTSGNGQFDKGFLKRWISTGNVEGQWKTPVLPVEILANDPFVEKAL